MRCKDAVKEIYYGLLECAKAFPKEYVDGCPYTYDVVYKAIKSEIIENYLEGMIWVFLLTDVNA